MASPTADASALERTEHLNERFNSGEALNKEIAAASPRTQETIKTLRELAQQRTDKELRDQKRSHKFRVNARKVELLENYILGQANRPDAANRDLQHDIRLIHEQAERNVRSREEYHLVNIYKETEANIRELLNSTRKQTQDPSLRHAFEQDHGRGR